MDFVDADDGTFHMSFDDYRENFKLTFISKYQDGFDFNSVKLPVDYQGKHLIKCEVPVTGEYTFGLSQKGERVFPLDTTY